MISAIANRPIVQGDVKKERKHPNPPRRCMFCGGGPISKEHVFAEWMHPYLPTPKGARRPHLVQVTKLPATGEVSLEPPTSGQFNRPGELKSKRLKIVCEPCNNGWMSVLQQSTKPVLLPFITGKWVTMNPAGQRILAAWISMFTMVVEKSDEPVETSTLAQRKAFKEQGEKRTPPKNWL